VVDVGGTSTDIAVLDEGFPQIQYEGATIGRWRTRVKAVDMYTVALGGDSRISVRDTKFFIGPERVVPISTLTEKYPEVAERMMHNDIFDYYVANDISIKGMTDKEKRIYKSIKGKGPLDSMQVRNATDGLWIIDEELASLTKRGALTAASLTPTDVMIFLGKFKAGNIRGAEAAVHAIAETMGMAMTQVAGMLFEEIKKKVSEAVVTKLLDDDMAGWRGDGTDTLMRKMVSLSRGRRIDLLPKIKVPIVGIGAPAQHIMEDIGERLGTTSVFSENHDVGNAVGAVSSKVAESLTATIQPTIDNRFAVSVPFMGTTYYSYRDTAISSCKKSMEDYLSQKVRRSGGTNLRTVSRVKTYLAAEGGYGNWDELAANINYIEVTTRTVGDPPQRV
jgi:N-methylhydantoinase A/oxoprolinase/acetone carboxylase beta subunit